MELSKKKISKIMKQKNQSRKKINKKSNRKKNNYKRSFRNGKPFNLRNKTLKHKIKLHGKADLRGGYNVIPSENTSNRANNIEAMEAEKKANALKKAAAEEVEAARVAAEEAEAARLAAAEEAEAARVAAEEAEAVRLAAAEEAQVTAKAAAAQVAAKAAAGAARVAEKQLMTTLAHSDEDEKTGEQTSPVAKVTTTTTMSEDDKYKKVTIIVRFPKDATIQSSGD